MKDSELVTLGMVLIESVYEIQKYDLHDVVTSGCEK